MGSSGINTVEVPPSVKGTNLAFIAAMKDVSIPPGGGESWDGFLWEPINTTLAAYAKQNGCKGSQEYIKSPFGESFREGNLIDCHGWTSCDGGRVVRCDFNEDHGFWPVSFLHPKMGEDLNWWLLGESLDYDRAFFV